MYNLSSTSARTEQQRPRHFHQATTLSKITSSIYNHQGEKVYFLDTYSKMGKRIALVMDMEEESIYEVFYDQLGAA